MKHTVFITGGSGYVGSLIVSDFSKREDVEKIIILDRKDLPSHVLELQKSSREKIVFVKEDMSKSNWLSVVSKFQPDIVIHCAWQIRSLFGRAKEQWAKNILGSDKVFDFAFNTASVKKLIHFSTVASYSARPDNSLSQAFTEVDPLRDSDFRYALEKKASEERLLVKYENSKQERSDLEVFVVRPASITGPYGKSLSKTGLQSILSGKGKSFFQKILSKILSFAPLTKNWVRQFVHENDVVKIIETLSFGEKKEGLSNYEIFNLCPPGQPMLAADMGRAVGKKVIFIHPQIIRFAFFILWHGTLGFVPTSKGGWKSYSYPIVVDGSKITKSYGYQYQFGPQESFTKTLSS